MNSRIQSPSSSRGFTLVEMIVVMALLMIVLMVTVTISNGSLDLIGRTSARVAADRIASTTFDQISRDVSQRLNRREPTLRVVKRSSAGNDELILITLRSGYPMAAGTADRRVSTVHYRVENHHLVQAASGYAYGALETEPDESRGMLNLYDLPETGPRDLSDGWFETLVPGVLRMEISHLASGPPPRPQAGAWLNEDEVDAMVVTLVVLDPSRSRMLSDAQRGQIASQFPDASDGELPFESWAETASELGTSASLQGVPRVALRHVRVYQRYIPLRSASTP